MIIIYNNANNNTPYDGDDGDNNTLYINNDDDNNTLYNNSDNNKLIMIRYIIIIITIMIL